MNDERAFPGIGFDRWGEIKNEYRGMTLRDYFAARALPFFLEKLYSEQDYSRISKMSYMVADEMLEARQDD